jgi:endonuclease/exonuclease/phosphatase family metal-dependent hydrolase
MRHVSVLWLVVAAGCSEATSPPGAAPPTIAAITYNMYLGLATEIVPETASASSLAGTLNAVIDAASLTDYACRIDGAASIIATEMPDVIGTQEAILIAYARDLDDRSRDHVVLDFIDELVRAIERHSGLRYQAFYRENTVIQAALPVVGGIRLIDRNAILVRPELPARQADSLTFQTLEPASDFVPTGTGEIVRGAHHVVIPFANGETIDVYNTHLQSSNTGSASSEGVRFGQVQELMSFIQSTRQPGSTIVLTGDMNDVPGTRTYDVLSSQLVDTYAAAGVPPGLTAYQDPVLTNPMDTSTMRIDYIFSDTPQVLDSHIIFNEMVPACTLWPSDHFGVSSRFSKVASQ